MPISPLTGLYIDETYPRLVQTNDTGTEFADGLGRAISFGTTSPGDGNQAIQFNSASVFSGSTKLKYDYVNSNIVLTGSLLVTQSYISKVDYIDFTPNKYDTVTPGTVPTHIEGRLFYDTGSQTLCMYNGELDVTLNIGQESWLRARNQTGVLIPNGSVVKISGAVGNRPSIALAQSTDQVQTFGVDNDIIGMATHDIEHGTDGFVTTFGLVNGVNTQGYSAGDLLWVSQSAGQYTNVAPSAPFDKTFVGVVTRVNPNNGTIFITPSQPIHFHDISSVSQSGNYAQGDIWMFRQSGSSGVWTNTKTLSGSYTLSGSLTTNDGVTVQTLTASTVSASSGITGSLYGTASWANNFVSASDYVLNSATSSFATTSSNTFIGNQTITGSIILPTLVGTTDAPFVNFTVPYSSGIYKVTAQADPTTIDMGGINLPPVVEGASFTIIVMGSNFNAIVNSPLYPINAKGQTIVELANKTIHNFYGIDGYWHVGGLNTL